MLQPYDDFLIAILLQLEALGFCQPGGGRRFVLDTDTSFRGRLPINTGGGQISSAGRPCRRRAQFRRGDAGSCGERRATRQVAHPRNASGDRHRLDSIYPQLSTAR